MDMSELDALQTSLNRALDAFREELTKENLPQLSTFSIEPHPLDAPEFLPSPRLYEARRLALGMKSRYCSIGLHMLIYNS